LLAIVQKNGRAPPVVSSVTTPCPPATRRPWIIAASLFDGHDVAGVELRASASGGATIFSRKTSSAMDHMSFQRFVSTARAEGFDEVLVREWAPGQVVETHRHPFAVKALVVRGDFWLTQGEHTRHLRAGDAFELARDVPHAERYGDAGATFWAARRHSA
jgi:quercetin dioxygenase-like cupin family protein